MPRWGKGSSMVYLFAVVTASVALSASISFAATSCTCSDICDIENAAAEARAAQWEYQRQILLLQNADDGSLTPTWYSPGRYTDVQKQVQKSINSSSAVCNPPLNHIRADTNGGNCQITVQPTSACLNEIATAHENIHQATCQSFDHILTYQMSMSLADVLAEEIRGYQTAIDMNKSLKDGPLKDCCCKKRCNSTTITGAFAILKMIARNLMK
jgi:hypothetical protein